VHPGGKSAPAGGRELTLFYRVGEGAVLNLGGLGLFCIVNTLTTRKHLRTE